MSTVIYPTSNLQQTEKLTIERGEGVYVYDSQGKQYLEGLAGLWCTSLGYGNQELIETTTEQMSKLAYSHMFGGKTHQAGIDLADKISEMVPVEDAHVFFGNSGSDANDTHIKLLRYYFNAIGKPEKYKIIARDRSYHGVTVAAASLTGLAPNHTHFSLPFDALGVLRTDAPHYLRGRLPGESEADFVERITNNLEQMILNEGPETIAAFIAEPITGASGVIVPPAGYYEKVQAILSKYDILFWADEVITGFGRTGNMFGTETYNLQPDMMTLSKALSSSYQPISALLINDKVYQPIADESHKIGVLGHGYTGSGHPVAAAVALENLKIIEERDLVGHVRAIAPTFQKRLAGLAENPLVIETRGIGLIGAAELSHEALAATPGALGAKTNAMFHDKGLISRNMLDAMAFCPPLIITEAQVNELFDIAEAGLKAVQESL